MVPGSTTHRRRPLVLLEGATLVSGVGNGMAMVAIPWLVLERTGEPGAAGLVAAFTALPLLASSLFSGTVVDMVGRRRTAIVSDLLSGLSAATIPLVDVFLGLNLPLLITLAVVGAVFDPAGVTARETMLPAAAQRAGWTLHRANGVHEAVWGVAFLVGPGVAGLLIAVIGAVETLWVAAGGFVLSSLALALFRLPGAGAPAEHHRPEGVWRGTREGLRFVWRDPLLRAITLVSAALVSVYLPIESVLLPVYFEARDEPGRLGVLLMAMSAGGVAGALGYAAVADRTRRSRAFRASLLATSIVLLGLAVLPSYGLMLVFGFGLGLSYGPVSALIGYATQARATEALRGRVTGIIVSADYAAGPLGFLVAGYATDRFGVGPTFLVLSLAIVGVAVAGALLPAVTHFDDPYETEPGEAPHGAVERFGEASVTSVPFVAHPPAGSGLADDGADAELEREAAPGWSPGAASAEGR